MSEETLCAFAAHAAGDIVYEGETIAFARLLADSRRLAEAMRRLGLARGDRVAVWLPDVPAWLTVFFACARLGAVALALNTRFRQHELEDILSRCACRLLVCWPNFRKLDFAATLAQCDAAALRSLEAIVAYSESGAPVSADVAGKPVHRYAALLQCPPSEREFADAGDGCIVFTTTGTTKAPKFALHSQRGIVRHARDVARAFGYHEPGACVLLSAPLCGAFGFCNAMAALAAGCPLVMQRWFDAKRAALAVRSFGVTHTHATDLMISGMLDAVPDRVAFPSARFFGYAAFTPQLGGLAARAEERGLRIVGLYGMSEIQALVARRDEGAPVAQRMQAGGRLVCSDAAVRARDADSGLLLGHGVPGELEFRLPSRMTGYLGDEAATRAVTTQDGWFRSGDLGYTTGPDGFTFLARLGDALRLSGFLVSPAEIEAVLQEHGDVAAAQVVAVETSAGSRPVAFVVLRPGACLDEAGILAHCRSRMAHYKRPLLVHAMEAFPAMDGANATKIQKAKLRDLAKSLLAERGRS